MRLDFGRAVDAEPALGAAGEQLVDEVGAFEVEVLGGVFLLQDDLKLFQLRLVPYPVFRHIRLLIHHQLIQNDPKRKEIRINAIVLPEGNLRSHIAGLPARVG